METKEKFIYVNEDECKMGEINCVQIGYRFASYSLLFSVSVGVSLLPIHICIPPRLRPFLFYNIYCWFIIFTKCCFRFFHSFFIFFLFIRVFIFFIVSNGVIISFELMNTLIFLFLRHSVPFRWTYWGRFKVCSYQIKICVFNSLESFELLVTDAGKLRDLSWRSSTPVDSIPTTITGYAVCIQLLLPPIVCCLQ